MNDAIRRIARGRVVGLSNAEVLLVARALKVYANRQRSEARLRGASGPDQALYRQALRQNAAEAEQLIREFSP